jgi:CRP-like cAMP-binding protein
MPTELILSTVDKLLSLGRVAWSHARLPVELRRLSVAAEHTRERSFARGAVLSRDGERAQSCYLIVQGRVDVSRRGAVLGAAEPGSLVGLEALLSQDDHGVGVVAATDVFALELEADTLLAVMGDHFPIVHEGIRATTARLFALQRRLRGPRDDVTSLLVPQSAGRRMNLVEVLLFLRRPGAPFERSSVEALADIALTFRQVPFGPGQVFWSQGEPADRLGLVVEGRVACTFAGADAPCTWQVGPGHTLGMLEAVAREPRWYQAVAETAGLVVEQDVEELADLFEDNVDVALDYLAWVSRSTLALIERDLGPGPDLLAFFTSLAERTVAPDASAAGTR